MDATSAVAHLLRRAGFGATSTQVASAAAGGYTAVVRSLVAGLGGSDPGAGAVQVPSLSLPTPGVKDTAARKAISAALAAERSALTTWWLSRMVASTNPLAEKLTFLMHGQFPTAISKVRYPVFMYRQNQIFRTMGRGSFDSLTQAIATDPAMLIWLDAASDRASDPNENFARELMERFCMGIGNYTEADVRAGAACFTGWTLDRAKGTFLFDPATHDNTPQVFLGNQNVNTGTQVIDIVTHSAASARYVPARFWSHLAYPVATTDPVVADLVPAYESDHDMTKLLQAIFEHPAFVSTAATTGLIKQPTEYVVGALRAFGLGVSHLAAHTKQIQQTLAGLGQVLFDPPSVGGWSQNSYWLSTAAALVRWRFAQGLVRLVDLSPVADATAPARPDAAAEVLSVPGWSATTLSALRGASADPEALMVLALVSPEYVSN